MNREELKPIELENNLGKDVNGVVHRVPWKAYDIEEADSVLDRLETEIRHNKLKRCLAMAEWCDAEADVADADGDYDDMRWYQKWHERWLELSNNFKPQPLQRAKEKQ